LVTAHAIAILTALNDFLCTSIVTIIGKLKSNEYIVIRKGFDTMQPKKYFLLVFLLGLFSILYALFAQYYQNFEPCPLCLAQRWVLYLITGLALLFALHNPINILIKAYSLIIIGFSIFGIKIAYHHLWIISLPEDQRPASCGMPLSMVFNKLNLGEFIQYILKGSAECGKIDWKIFGMIAPQAFIVLCAIIIILMLLVLFSKQKNKYYNKL
jgi:disulfide bond formation protein DsbB